MVEPNVRLTSSEVPLSKRVEEVVLGEHASYTRKSNPQLFITQMLESGSPALERLGRSLDKDNNRGSSHFDHYDYYDYGYEDLGDTDHPD